MVARWRVCVLVADRRGRHLVVALGAGTGLIGALRGRGRVGRILLRVVPANTRTSHSDYLRTCRLIFVFVCV